VYVGPQAPRDGDLSQLDTNEGFASRFIGCPDTVLERARAYREIGVDMLHLALGDTLFEEQVLPDVIALA
jgi:alkanesulfonate monooxygenase SsuD/methylene tetrahydromethanopterin reductase-like flavin-dependent oxidoreductase (luciferase family)